MSDWTRRQVLLGTAGALALPGVAAAFGESSLVDIAEIDLGSGTQSRPEAWRRLMHDVMHSTSVECQREPVLLKPEDPELFEHPFAVILGDGAFSMPSEEGMEQLSRYLAYGGFLLLDDTSGAVSSGFDRSARRLARALFPTRPLAPITDDHSIYMTFFLIQHAPWGRVDTHDALEAVTVGNVCPLVYSRNDLSGALQRTRGGRPVHPVVPRGEFQRIEATKLAVNLVMYSLTANYKKDIAHQRELMMEGRFR